MFETITAVFLGFLLDCVLGDPHWLPHPVRAMGWLIVCLENATRRIFYDTKTGRFLAGLTTALTVIVVFFGIGFGAIWITNLIGGRRLTFLVEILLCWQCIAARSLARESKKVFKKLEKNDLSGARQAVSMIVGRDTQKLNAAEITKAAVETVAENASDGVIAPIFFLMLGGVPLGFTYKAINTLDSMIGYKNETYCDFGYFAARLDDLVNWIPSRLSALFMIAAAWLGDFDGMGAWQIWRRDRRNHTSPNSAQTESVCAGALGIELAGDAFYQGRLVHKLTIGDPLRTPEPEDILRAGWLMYAAAVISLPFCAAIKIVFMLLGGLYG